ncbi:MAG: isopentenyl-diphosphate Delta-isomerase [Ferruginibacter sp.]
MSQVITVNESDIALGSMGKMEAHEKGILHRAFSVFIFNTKGAMLLQQRALNKYHSGGLWSNACCSHPQPGEDTSVAAYRRLKEEMGFTANLDEAFSFLYKTNFDNGLSEHEYDHVFTGIYDGDINPDKKEVKDYCFLPMNEIRTGLQAHPQKYTSWFKIAFPKLEDYLATVSV